MQHWKLEIIFYKVLFSKLVACASRLKGSFYGNSRHLGASHPQPSGSSKITCLRCKVLKKVQHVSCIGVKLLCNS